MSQFLIYHRDYFDKDIHEGDVAYKDYFPKQDQADFLRLPKGQIDTDRNKKP